MKPATATVLLLVVVVLLYVAALALGLVVNGRGGASSAGESDRDWLAGLGALSAPFAPHLDVSRLQCKAAASAGVSGKSQAVAKAFKLTEDHPTCDIEFPGDKSEDYRRAELELLPGASSQPAVYVLAAYEQKPYPSAKRDRSKCFLDEPSIPHAFRLQLRFEIDLDEMDNPWTCWLHQDARDPVSITVLEDGGKVTLECVGCNASARREIGMRMQ